MKPSKIKINEVDYQPIYGMAVIEKIGEELNLEFLDEVLTIYASLDFNRLKLADMKNISLLIRCAIQLGLEESGKSLDIKDSEIKDWVFHNIAETAKSINDFALSLRGNVKAPKGAKKQKATQVA